MILRGVVAAVFALCLAQITAQTAAAQPSEIVLEAQGPPIVEADINGQSMRLLVDPALPDFLFVNTEVAARLGLRAVPFSQARAEMDGVMVTARIARPDLRFANGETERVTGLIFAAPVTDLADGAIGPGVLPYRVVTFRLGPEPAGARDLNFDLEDADLWSVTTTVAPEREMQVGFMLTRPDSMLNRPAAGLLEADRLLTPVGELEPREFLLGLQSLMQPVSTDPTLNVGGLRLGPTLARTASPIIGAEDDAAIFVIAESDRAPPPRLALGREALRVCASMSVNRRAKRLTMRCAIS